MTTAEGSIIKKLKADNIKEGDKLEIIIFKGAEYCDGRPIPTSEIDYDPPKGYSFSIEISNFDWDNDGIIRVFSVAKNGINCEVSGEDKWERKILPVVEEEKNSSMEIQFIKNQNQQIRNNNVVVAVRNQYGASLPFYVIPIGGIPVYSPKIRMK